MGRGPFHVWQYTCLGAALPQARVTQNEVALLLPQEWLVERVLDLCNLDKLGDLVDLLASNYMC